MSRNGVFHTGTVEKMMLFAVVYWYPITDFWLVIIWTAPVRSTFEIYVMMQANLKWEDSDRTIAEKQ